MTDPLSAPLWTKFVEWAWVVLATIFGVITTLVGIVFNGLRKDIKANSDEIRRVDGEMNEMRASMERKMEAVEERRREDTIGLHKKIDAGFDRLSDKLDKIRQ